MSTCTPYNDPISYDANLIYDGECVVSCPTYDEAISYNASVLYDGECVTPPVPSGNHKGGATIYVVHQNPEELRLLRKRRREDEEILIL